MHPREAPDSRLHQRRSLLWSPWSPWSLWSLWSASATAWPGPLRCQWSAKRTADSMFAHQTVMRPEEIFVPRGVRKPIGRPQYPRGNGSHQTRKTPPNAERCRTALAHTQRHHSPRLRSRVLLASTTNQRNNEYRPMLIPSNRAYRWPTRVMPKWQNVLQQRV